MNLGYECVIAGDTFLLRTASGVYHLPEVAAAGVPATSGSIHIDLRSRRC